MPNGIRPADKAPREPKVDDRIAGAFARASEATGTSFDYLVATSKRESDHRPDLGSSTSSAKGLFQFVDQTWLGLVKREGPSVGLEKVADKIVSDGKGGWTVKDLNDKTKILALKTDPLVASVMAGRFTQDNARQLREGLGREASDGELYAAHVLGAAGALKLMRVAKSEPNATAATIFPRAAAANSDLFYGAKGTPKTAKELLAGLTTPRAAEDPTSARITAAHQAMAGANAKADPATLAALVRAQAAAVVAKEATGAGNPVTAATIAADRRYANTALSATTQPGEARGVVPPMAGGLGGWRAGATRDAFTGLMRSDAATAADGAARLGGTPATGATAAAVSAPARVVPPVVASARPDTVTPLAASATTVVPRTTSPDGPPPIISAPGETVAATHAPITTQPTTTGTVPLARSARAPLLPPVAGAATGLPAATVAAGPTSVGQTVPSVGGPATTGGGRGGIPTVDPFRPMNIGAPSSASGAPAPAPTVTSAVPTGAAISPALAQPVVTTAQTAVQAPTQSAAAPTGRPSRVFAYAAAGGAPAAPFPVVDAANGATRPSRLLFEQQATPEPGGAVASGAVRVRTTTVTPPTPAAVAAPATQTTP